MREMTEQELADFDAWKAARDPGPQPRAYDGPQGGGSLAAPLQPDPAPPARPAEPEQPHPGETFAPGELATYAYHDHRDPEGTTRSQVVMVTHVDDDHVHGLVVGQLRDVASFPHGALTHGG